MTDFKSLNPAGLADTFDAAVHGEEPFVEVEESEGRIALSYTFPGFSLSEDIVEVDGDGTTFHQVNISKTGYLAESGKPLLPSFGRYVQIPPNCKFKVTSKKGRAVQFEDILVLPAQEELTDAPDEEHALEYDRAAYETEERYPKDVVEVSGPFDLDGYDALLVQVRPFQYNAAKRTLHGYANISVAIELTPQEGEEADEICPADPELDREGFGNLLVNPARRIEGRLGLERPRIIRGPLRCGPELLIIYHETFKTPAARLAKWKNMRGLATATVSISTVGNTVAKIKKHIRDRRKAPFSRLRYVLLFGDVGAIAAETVQGGLWGSNVSDYYYATPRDPAGPNDCVLPWIAIGRIPVQTEAEGFDVVDQVIRYEKNPPCDPEYYRRMAFAAFFQDNPPQDGKADRRYMKTMEAIRQHMLTLGFDVERIYVSNNPSPQEYRDGTPVPAEVRSAIVDAQSATDMLISTTSEGQLVAGHRDHGGPDGWSHPSFTTDHLDAILSEYPSIFYSINCLTGRFDLTSPTECFAEMLLRIKGGAPSLIAATRVSGTWRNDSMMKALFDAMWGGVLPTFPGSTASYPVRNCRLGDILNYAKAYLPIAHSGDNAGIRDHFEIYHVIGDPTLELWKAQPGHIGLQANVVGTYLCIILSAPPPKGAVITVWHGDRLLKKIQPSSTHVKIPLRSIAIAPPIRRALAVCCWAPGHRFRQIIVRH